jgi:hypothetical protein
MERVHCIKDQSKRRLIFLHHQTFVALVHVKISQSYNITLIMKSTTIHLPFFFFRSHFLVDKLG